MGRGLLGYPIRPAGMGKAQITHVSSQERCSTYLESLFREADRGYHCQCGEAGHSPRTFRNQRLFDADRELGRSGDRAEWRWIGTGTGSSTGDVVRNFGSCTGRRLPLKS